MAKLTVGEGVQNYTRALNELLVNMDHDIGQAIYEGAKIVADACKKNIDALPVAHAESYHKGATMNGVTTAQKRGLQEGFGIAKMKKDGSFINVKLGVDGYNSQVTDKYPNGQPNAMIARSLESGSSFRVKHPIFAPAVRATRSRAEQAMGKKLDEIYEKTMK